MWRTELIWKTLILGKIDRRRMGQQKIDDWIESLFQWTWDLGKLWELIVDGRGGLSAVWMWVGQTVLLSGHRADVSSVFILKYTQFKILCPRCLYYINSYMHRTSLFKSYFQQPDEIIWHSVFWWFWIFSITILKHYLSHLNYRLWRCSKFCLTYKIRRTPMMKKNFACFF